MKRKADLTHLLKLQKHMAENRTHQKTSFITRDTLQINGRCH